MFSGLKLYKILTVAIIIYVLLYRAFSFLFFFIFKYKKLSPQGQASFSQRV